MNDHPNRKPNRLPQYDYASAGAYFITFCTKDRARILSRVVPAGTDSIRPQAQPFLSEFGDPFPCTVILTNEGQVVHHAIRSVSTHYPNIFVDRFVIMPNHVHLLLRITGEDGRMISAPTVIGSLKRFVTKLLGRSVWQKGFYDHIIRCEDDYALHCRYIDENPWKWILGDDQYA